MIDCLDKERLLGKCEVVTETGCWIFMGHLDHRGYGDLWFRGRNEKAHRVSYILFKGMLPVDFNITIHHTCNTPSCVNPEHLEVCTRSENRKKSALIRIEDKITMAKDMYLWGFSKGNISNMLGINGQTLKTHLKVRIIK